jgi:hypothetical protein
MDHNGGRSHWLYPLFGVLKNVVNEQSDTDGFDVAELHRSSVLSKEGFSAHANLIASSCSWLYWLKDVILQDTFSVEKYCQLTRIGLEVEQMDILSPDRSEKLSFSSNLQELGSLTPDRGDSLCDLQLIRRINL